MIAQQQQQQQQQQHPQQTGSMVGSSTPPNQQNHPTPLYDLFLDLPHPCASSSCPGPFIIDSPPPQLPSEQQQQQQPVNSPTAPPSSSISVELHKNLLQIVRFAFPEYDEKIEQQQTGSERTRMNRYDVYAVTPRQQPLQQQQQQQQQPQSSALIGGAGGGSFGRVSSFQSFTFSMQLSTGVRVHGHVRRYLPPHLIARTRYDVGRRGERALCILTRCTGADLLYSSILKTIEAISSQQAAQSFVGTNNNNNQRMVPHKGEPQKWFLHQLSRYHIHLRSLYGTKAGMERGKPLIAALPCVEIGDEYHSIYKEVELSRFIIPISLLQQQQQQQPANHHKPQQTVTTPSGGSIVPLLRCVGVVHTLRIMAALLCERRIVFVSASPTRLATCSNAAVSMLSCGLLHWQHLYIPVLPPHLWPYLAAPYPYLIGILASAAHKLDRTDGLGEVLIIHLDTNQLETRGMEQEMIPQRLPDLFRLNAMAGGGSVYSSSTGHSSSGLNPDSSSSAVSASEQLAQDLLDVLKTDRKILYGITPANAVNAFVGETATKATQAMKNTFFKLRDKGRQYLSQRSNVSASATTTTGGGEDEDQLGGDEGGGGGGNNGTDEYGTDGQQQQQQQTSSTSGGGSTENSMASDYIYTEGCHNETSEEEVRISFTSFFLCLIGDIRWYLSTSTQPTTGGQPIPVLDRAKLMQQKRAMGEGEGTAIYPLLTGFCQTQMLEEFAKARIEELQLQQQQQQQQPVAPDAPLFLQCMYYHRQHRIDFGTLNVKRIVRQIAENDPKLTGMLQTNVRKTAMALTSNKGLENNGDVNKVTAQLIDQCRESTYVLFDVMSVIWFRLRDCKGMQWKHAVSALHIVRHLLYHGPLAAITEAIDGLEKIRSLQYYDNIRPVSVSQVREAATSVYTLLIDRAKLFHIRRTCIERRRQIQFPHYELKREKHVTLAPIGVAFRVVHAAMNPNTAHGTRVQLPPVAPTTQSMVRDPPPPNHPLPTTTAASTTAPPPTAAAAVATKEIDFFAMPPPTPAAAALQQQQPQPQPQQPMQPSMNTNNNNDVLNLFNSMAVSTPTTTTTNVAANPFDPFGSKTLLTSPTTTTTAMVSSVPSGPGISPHAGQQPQQYVPPQQHVRLPNQMFPQQQQQQQQAMQPPSQPFAHTHQTHQPSPTFAVMPPMMQTAMIPNHPQQQMHPPMQPHMTIPPQQYQQQWPPPQQQQQQQQTYPVPMQQQQRQPQQPVPYAIPTQSHPASGGGTTASATTRPGSQFDPFAKK